MTPAFQRVLALSQKDQERIVRNEERLKMSEPVTQVVQIPGLPFHTMQELWEGKAQGRFVVVMDIFAGDELEAFGSTREVITNALISYLVGVVALAYVVVAFVSKDFILVAGVATSLAGMFLGRILFIPAIVLGILTFLFRWGGSTTAILVGFFIGCGLQFLLRLHASIVIERIAISSETVFCYLYRRGIIAVVDKQSGVKVRLPLDIRGERNLISSAKNQQC